MYAARHTAAFETIAANQEQPAENADRINLLVRTAFERLRTGTGSPADFDRVAAAFNVALIRSEGIDPLVEEAMQRGINAMVGCDRIHRQHRKYGFTGPGLQAATEAMDVYEQILRLSTPRQMEDAVNEAARRMLAQARESAIASTVIRKEAA